MYILLGWTRLLLSVISIYEGMNIQVIVYSYVNQIYRT